VGGITAHLTQANLLTGVVPVQLVHTTREGKADQKGKDQETQHVVDHASERQLQWAEVGTDGAEVDQLEDTEYVGGGE